MDSEQINNIVQNSKNQKNMSEAMINFINYLIIISGDRAAYFPTGSEDDDRKWGHFSLALDRYTHFTSPIRRYSDVIVHRQLLETLLDNRYRRSQANMKQFPDA